MQQPWLSKYHKGIKNSIKKQKHRSEKVWKTPNKEGTDSDFKFVLIADTMKYKSF